ncbi:C6 zinc finger domain containing protein [Metarhizium album ARSEF 1941]|uniref:C6 zinc finger domain containing protein n=1 Tax=Metarhizium album (strain ARSEF 1941) TaxID=1081103 RepID=A0A0B2X151_METAS|nr:C6 zinc finger domain containing protein [Metarhizium album ARSEF 1941]KHO00059.1 C6 zinc finger domain containing protein [Metarhizium album ARSEF 1941]
MAEWAQSIFPALWKPFLGDFGPMSNVTLAMTVLLIALEIMSPSAFGRGVSWREHVAHARRLLAKRLEQAPQDASVEGLWFIQSWLGYVDIMGGLVTRPGLGLSCQSQVYFPLSEPHEYGKDLDEIDCMMGISVRCARLLSQVAELAQQCQGERFGVDGQMLRGWYPRPAMVRQARLLEDNLMESLRRSSRPCPHVRAGSIRMKDLAEMAGVNEAFHWAGLIHLHRRVLGKPTNHADVQGNVRKIMQCLEQIGTEGVAKTRYLFPIFTAGCEALTERQRARLLSRLASAEKIGMKQVRELSGFGSLSLGVRLGASKKSLTKDGGGGCRYTQLDCCFSRSGQPARHGRSSFATSLWREVVFICMLSWHDGYIIYIHT